MKTNALKSFEYRQIADDLLKGNVVGFPTETVYGLAIVYDSVDAFTKLYEIKNRNINKPISMMVADIETISSVAYVDEKAKKVINAFMPGPITIILKAKEDLPEHVTFKLSTIGIRIPNHQTALNVLKEVKKPLLVSSANISNEPSLIKAMDVKEIFGGKIASFIEEDAVDGIASTVVDLTTDPIKIYRQGPISEEEILKVIGE
jgi:L-threonylcarbamoyladenylate synthase